MEYDAYRSYHAVNLEAQTRRLAGAIGAGAVRRPAGRNARARPSGNQRYEQKGESISKCINILNGLSSALDFDSGGEVVTNLARLYDYCAYRLYHASVNLDVAALDEVELLIKLKGGWIGVRDQHEAA